jgi:dipeptidyl aminopeptidase/acylaminoacyl peptidase
MPDTRVQAAIDNWAPRFTSQGVDFNDFVRTTHGLERWDDWLDAWTALGDLHTNLAEVAALAGRDLTAGEAYVRAALSYHFANFVWMVDLAKHRRAAEQAVRALYKAHDLLQTGAERIEAPLDAATMVANLRLPSGSPHPPLVLLLPGLDSTKEEFFHWENVFLARGLATLSMEGPGQGETGYETTIRHDYEVAVSGMLDALVGRAELDLRRVAVVGVSLGGYYAPRAAAFEPRLKAAVAIGGPYNFGECWASLPPITKETYQHHSGAADEKSAKEHALTLDLSGIIGQVRQPLLVVFGKLDRLIPHQQAERVALEAPRVELVMYPEGNHVCNNIPYKYRPLVADWVVERLADVG